tara:strand:- start:427 stop:723 length:297 start_codon:yes stop_codon:yes gene_type:complete
MNYILTIPTTQDGLCFVNTEEVFTVAATGVAAGVIYIRLTYKTGSTVARFTDLRVLGDSIPDAVSVTKQLIDCMINMTDGQNIFTPTIPINSITTTIT